jgi:N6-adenosine-specific RNA methylase IME4
VRYRTIVADPPWSYHQRAQSGKRDRRASASDFYDVMSWDAIARLPVVDLADTDAHLYLWVTNALLFEDRDGWTIPRIVGEWGFTYKTLLTWNKTGPTGLGRYFRGRTEHVVFAVRGSCGIEPTMREQNIFHAVNGAHSAKPDCFYDLVERVSPGPYLELFARRARFGWDYWGDQSLGTAVVPQEMAA